ncbi:hypothetical protein HBI56_155530 [Parastagonospora nodorum]|uniref:Uncharacterized protein n=1 Tax=Phaeosphaeria nodorum (strain SN15 / ATCC MYA-4574 / FGSC 10173) TaxID=321614 RepID=A0A7U2I8N6_PHANO|nr:hypothetical protein HBH56_118230 [Parastagonospora nodorum]QRD05269.1 hypothetical protein JI435_111660 [Parastagonospora nodorum SN15]KAH3928882.1 hypothetical protein HBH54_130980 [Parastagonospora nodorum]KAH3950528.1 hypothetical protein HBH53_071250 [Parastagonospora nodorum]KAH3959850.1 hypothetical protein HBH51_196640 [Parastagonospora nodorum]
MKLDVDEWVRAQYTEKHCDKYGRLGGAVNLERFLSRLIKLRPDIAAAITDCVQRLDIGICEHICQAFPTNKHGKFTDVAALSEQLVRVRPDLKNDAKRDKLILRLQEIRKANLQRAAVPALAKPLSVPPGGANDGPSHAHTTTTDESLQVWISSLYPETGFKGAGFIGWAAFSAALVKAKPARSLEIRATLKEQAHPLYTRTYINSGQYATSRT